MFFAIEFNHRQHKHDCFPLLLPVLLWRTFFWIGKQGEIKNDYLFCSFYYWKLSTFYCNVNNINCCQSNTHSRMNNGLGGKLAIVQNMAISQFWFSFTRKMQSEPTLVTLRIVYWFLCNFWGLSSLLAGTFFTYIEIAEV